MVWRYILHQKFLFDSEDACKNQLATNYLLLNAINGSSLPEELTKKYIRFSEYTHYLLIYQAKQKRINQAFSEQIR